MPMALTKTRQLSVTEIKALYQFTRQHYVEYEDLQQKLVHQLTQGIETRWLTQPQLSFEDNLSQEFKTYGVLGFSTHIEAHQKAMDKLYWKLIWQEICRELTRPVSWLILIALGIGNTFLIQRFNTITKWIYLSIFLIFFGYTLIRRIQRKRSKPLTAKRYLLKDIIDRCNGLWMLLYLQFFIFNTFTSGLDLSNFYGAMSWAVFLSICSLFCYITTVKLPHKKTTILAALHSKNTTE